MMQIKLSKMILLSGPSCAGKTPLLQALKRTYPGITFGRPILYTSRHPRPHERDGVDYFFRPEAEIRDLDKSRFIVDKTRRLWQAIDLDQGKG